MKVSEKFFRNSIINCIKSARDKVREIDAKTYPGPYTEVWRLSRDASLILEDVLDGLENIEEDND